MRKLTKRNYLGEGYLHHFRNNDTNEIVFVPCTRQEYERLGEKDGSKFNPTLDGHTWVCSEGGTVKVDTPNTVLGLNEYCVKGEEVVARLEGKKHEFGFVPKDKVKDDEIDENLWL